MPRLPILVPKNGSTTIAKSLGLNHKHEYSKTIREKHPGVQLGATIRNPEDRLLSAWNHIFNNSEIEDWSDLFQKAFSEQKLRTTVWDTQKSWVDEDTELFLFEGLPILRWLGYSSKPPVWNEGKKQYPLDKLKEYPEWGELLSFYEEDWELYKKLKG